MIVDVHTHAFPPSLIACREQLAELDEGFAELYGRPAARMATADDLLASMAEARVDVSVAAGFWWREPEVAEEHAAYLLEASAAADGRLLPFVPLAAGVANEGGTARPDRVQSLLEAGAAGFGEARITGDPEEGARWLAEEPDLARLPLLVHCSEPVGHPYPGKRDGLTIEGVWELAQRRAAPTIAAHWGAGLPFFALMPEVRAVLAEGRLAFDSAATPLLYEAAIFRRVIDLVGLDLVLWGSDFPLRDQARDRVAVEAALPDPGERRAVLGENAARLLRLAD